MSGLLWHGSKWSRRFGRFLQYTPGLEVLACSFDTDFNYVTSMLQLCLSLNHFVKTCKEMMDFRTSFSDVFSGTYINPRGALSWTRDPLLNFPAKCINFEIPSWVFCGLGLFALSLRRLSYYLHDWLLALTRYMLTSIPICVCVCVGVCLWFWRITISAAFKFFLSQSRCSLQSKKFFRGLAP